MKPGNLEFLQETQSADPKLSSRAYGTQTWSLHVVDAPPLIPQLLSILTLLAERRQHYPGAGWAEEKLANFRSPGQGESTPHDR
jgi:hypothetical protein